MVTTRTGVEPKLAGTGKQQFLAMSRKIPAVEGAGYPAMAGLARAAFSYGVTPGLSELRWLGSFHDMWWVSIAVVAEGDEHLEVARFGGVHPAADSSISPFQAASQVGPTTFGTPLV
jgi:hypothetical protein